MEVNRFGEVNIKPSSFHEDLEPAIDWSDDPRSESSHEKYIHSDESIREKVRDAFLLNPDLDPNDIQVSVDNGIVTINGPVLLHDEHALVEEVARSVAGVKDVIIHFSEGKFDVGDDPGGLIKGMR